MAKRTREGHELPNGAMLIARRKTEQGHEIVLAVYPDRTTSPRDPEYITWRVFREDDKTTEQGHYFHSGDRFAEAVRDFMERR